jgi:predicted ATPase/DNA-binding SARP family transcriptional activator
VFFRGREALPVQFRILGPVQADGPDGPVAVGGPRHRLLLATLLTSPGVPVPSERLVEALWDGAPPRKATELLHVRMSELRKNLRCMPDLIVTRRPGYLLDIDPGQVDAHRFEQEALDGRRALGDGDAAVAARRLAAALDLWRGPALADIATRQFAQPLIARLENLRTQAVEDRIAATLELGGHRDVLAQLEALVREHPLHERHRRQLMLALYRDGRQNEALQSYQQGVERLRDELGVDPGRDLQAMRMSILRHDPALAAPATVHAPRPQEPELPVPFTSFVGRDAEIDSTCTQLDASRLVTLTGVGGSGKSRLAIEVAHLRREAFPDGVRVVELAAVSDPSLIEATVGTAVGAREQPQQPVRAAIVGHLRSRSVLLVLDNCEHLVDRVADLTLYLLGHVPGLRVLCTSRERLGITGEVVLPVPGLSLPPPDAVDAEAVRASSAVRLFVDRASAAQPHFRLTDGNASAVAEIVRRLDGLPLSIELAAARTSAFSVAQISHGLRDRFRMLSRGSRDALPRHQTLRAVVDWSYALLTEREQRLFDALSVFAGGFSYGAAAAVYGDEPGDLLARLVDKSLIVADTGELAEYRYRMLETLRAYGLEGLERRTIAAELRNEHARHYLELATAAATGLRNAELGEWLDRLGTEHGNLRAAMDWALGNGDVGTAAGIASTLYPFWDLRGHYSEGRDWLRRVLAGRGSLPPAVRARTLMGAATLAVIQGDMDESVTACREAAELGEAAGDDAVVAHALQYLGFVSTLIGDLDEARALLDDSRRIAAAAGALWEHAWSYAFLATLAFADERFADANAHADAAELVIGPNGDQELLAWVPLIRGVAAWGQGRCRDAAEHLITAAERFQALGGLWGLSLTLMATGLTLTGDSRDRAAIHVFGTAEAVRSAAGIGLMPFAAEWQDRALAGLRSRVAPETFDEDWASGQARSLDEAAWAVRFELGALPCTAPSSWGEPSALRA